MSRSIRCSDQAYQRVTAVAGEKGLSLVEALDDIIIITKQAQAEKVEPPATTPATNAVPYFQFDGMTLEEVKDTVREVLKEGLRQNQPGSELHRADDAGDGTAGPRYFEVVP